MRQTICQECGAVNKAEAVVCSSCGVQLDHAEKRLFNRLKEQGFFSRIASAPFRLIRWILKKIKLVLSILAVSLVVGGGFILFLIFYSSVTALISREDTLSPSRPMVISVSPFSYTRLVSDSSAGSP